MGLVSCLKKIPAVLFGFYVFIAIAMFFVQMLLFSPKTGDNEPCMTATPLLYWWLMVQVVIFYLIVSFGLATWGAYLCQVADVQEEVTKQAIDEYLKENQHQQKHFMITAGTKTPLLTEAKGSA